MTKHLTTQPPYCLQCLRTGLVLTAGRCGTCRDRTPAKVWNAHHGEPVPLPAHPPRLAFPAFARGVNYQVLYASATAMVESVLDPQTGQEVNRLTCTGPGWPDTPLANVLRDAAEGGEK